MPAQLISQPSKTILTPDNNLIESIDTGLDPAKRILIVSSQTGGGHRSAARALEASLTEMGALTPLQIAVAHRILEESSGMTRVLANAYNYMLRYHQSHMHHYFRWIESLKLHNQPMVLKMSWRYCQNLLERFRASAVVSVHPMMQHIFAGILKTLGWADKVPLMTVVTDPGKDVWQGWACPDVKRYFVPSAESRDYLISLGVPEEKIDVSGMPVHPKFCPTETEDEKRALRERLGLNTDCFTVFLNAGWMGGGNVPALLDAVMMQVDTSLQIVFLAGRNRKLYHDVLRKSLHTSMPITVLPYVQNIHEWMQASDVLVTKLGGLTTFESLSCHLPILADCITPPMPQEAETANMIARTDTGMLIYSVPQFLETVNLLRTTPGLLNYFREHARRLAPKGAAHHIAKEILHI